MNQGVENERTTEQHLNVKMIKRNQGVENEITTEQHLNVKMIKRNQGVENERTTEQHLNVKMICLFRLYVLHLVYENKKCIL